MVGQPRKERKRIVEELKEYDFGAELGRAEAKRRKRTEEAEVKKEEPEAEDDDDADDEVAEVTKICKKKTNFGWFFFQFFERFFNSLARETIFGLGLKFEKKNFFL